MPHALKGIPLRKAPPCRNPCTVGAIGLITVYDVQERENWEQLVEALKSESHAELKSRLVFVNATGAPQKRDAELALSMLAD